MQYHNEQVEVLAIAAEVNANTRTHGVLFSYAITTLVKRGGC